MKKITTILALALTVSACATNKPPLTLEEKLQGKSGEERREVLRLACLNEAEWPIFSSYKYKNGTVKQRMRLRNGYNSEVSEMKSLCRKMNESEAADKAALFDDCKQKIAAKSEKHGDKAVGHTQRTLQICQEMTGQNTATKTKGKTSKNKVSK